MGEINIPRTQQGQPHSAISATRKHSLRTLASFSLLHRVGAAARAATVTLNYPNILTYHNVSR